AFGLTPALLFCQTNSPAANPDPGTERDEVQSVGTQLGSPAQSDVPAGAETVEYCAPGINRALVLSGGGLKGAFQAGAVYHLIVQRRCDFREFAGVSVGSLNAVI